MNARTLAAMAAVVISAITAHGQEFLIRGLTLGQDEPAPEVHVHHDGGAPDAGVIQVKSYLNHEVDKLKLKGRKIVLTTQAGAASVKDPALLVGSCELPAKGGSLILLFVPEKPGSPACKVVVIEDSKKAFPPGSFKVVNLSSLPVKVELEGEPFDFKPGEIRNIEKPPVGDSGTSGAKVSCEKDGKWQKFSTGAWPDPGGKRVLQVVLDEPSSKLAEIRGIRDIVMP